MSNTLVVAYDISQMTEAELQRLLQRAMDAAISPSAMSTFNVLETPFIKICGRLEDLELPMKER
jgi:hypothetical protein